MSRSTPRSLVRRAAASDPELTLLPFMNLMTLLIPFLLVSAQFVSLATIDSSAPSIVPPSASAESEPLYLTIGISDDGFLLRGNSEALEAAQPIERLSDGRYDFAALTDRLDGLKEAHPQEENVILAPDDDITYETVVAVMDAARRTAGASGRDLFPHVVFAGGVKSP